MQASLRIRMYIAGANETPTAAMLHNFMYAARQDGQFPAGHTEYRYKDKVVILAFHIYTCVLHVSLFLTL